MKTVCVTKLGSEAKKVLRWVCAACGKDESRYIIMMGVCLSTDPDGLRQIAATDGRRLHVAPGELLEELPGDGVYQVREIGKACGEAWVAMEGTFPEWRRVMVLRNPKAIPIRYLKDDEEGVSKVITRGALIGAVLCPRLVDGAVTRHFRPNRMVFDADETGRYDNGCIHLEYPDGMMAAIMPLRDQDWQTDVKLCEAYRSWPSWEAKTAAKRAAEDAARGAAQG